MRAAIACCALLAATAAAGDATPPRILRYDATWHGLKVGEMDIETGVATNGAPYRRLSVRNSFLARAFSRVDTEMTSETSGDGADRRVVFSKRIRESDFTQCDTMSLWPERGIAVYVDAVSGSAVTSRVDMGALDVATFFCGLGEQIAAMDAASTNRLACRVVNDGQMHEVELVLKDSGVDRLAGELRPVRGLEIVSHSDALFVRNRPELIKVATDDGALVEMTVGKPFGNVRFRLRE